MNAIEKRFFDAFSKVCSSGYVAQSIFNGIRVELQIRKEIDYDEYEDSSSFDTKITTFSNTKKQFEIDDMLTLSSQEKINNGYVIDFKLATMYPEIIIAIEINGHEWHEKTKEQASRDKERARYLLKNGYNLIEYTGSEIYTKPDECAKETLDILIELYRNTLSKTPESFYAYIAKESK